MSLSWDTDTALRDSAVQACQQALQAREQQGESRRQVLQMGLSTQVAGPSFGFHFFCADHGLASEKQDRYRNATVAVQCQAVNLPDPTPVTAGPSQVAAPQEIKHVSLTVSPAQHHGPCPVTLQLRGVVHHLPTGGQVSHRFVYNGQPLGPFQALPLNPQGTSTPVERTHVVMPPVAQPPHPIVADKAFQPAARRAGPPAAAGPDPARGARSAPRHSAHAGRGSGVGAMPGPASSPVPVTSSPAIASRVPT